VLSVISQRINVTNTLGVPDTRAGLIHGIVDRHESQRTPSPCDAIGGGTYGAHRSDRPTNLQRRCWFWCLSAQTRHCRPDHLSPSSQKISSRLRQNCSISFRVPVLHYVSIIVACRTGHTTANTARSLASPVAAAPLILWQRRCVADRSSPAADK